MGPTDDPSNRESTRPTVRPVLLRRKTNTGLSATKLAGVGRDHKRGGAAFGRATSFVVSFGLVLNKVNIAGSYHNTCLACQ